MNKRRKVHDGIVGAIITASVLLGIYVNPMFHWVAVVVGVLMVSSAFTGFCPVYFCVDRCVQE